jgi:hypothetical protein
MPNDRVARDLEEPLSGPVHDLFLSRAYEASCDDKLSSGFDEVNVIPLFGGSRRSKQVPQDVKGSAGA